IIGLGTCGTIFSIPETPFLALKKGGPDPSSIRTDSQFTNRVHSALAHAHLALLTFLLLRHNSHAEGTALPRPPHRQAGARDRGPTAPPAQPPRETGQVDDGSNPGVAATGEGGVDRAVL
ncbi:MAG: hypothetical protein Q9210_006080, partial [Variospora velana]